MKREIIAILTLGSFIVFSFSCYSVQPIKPEMLSSPKADKIKIRKIEKTSGESIEFSASDPGRVSGNFVTGTGALTTAVEFVEIASADVQTTNYYQDEKFLSVNTRDGKSYDCKKIVKQGDKSVLHVLKAITNRVNSFFKVSLSEVERAWAKRWDIGITFALVIFPVVILVIAAIANPMRPFSL
jgi:hypothetical protein